MIISLEDVSYKYGIEPILDHVNFVVNEKDKWGVVGLNGAGKSTFMKILAGVEKPDAGNVTVLKKYKISYCPQSSDFPSGKTIYETVRSALSEEAEVYQINAILNKLGITEYEQKIDVLSGGQKKRVALAISLIQKADLYLLDEPTNHLDQEMVLWLEKYLARVSKAVVLITHDRYFLSRITNHIVEVDNGHLYQYDGDYAVYLEQREMRREQAMASEQKRQNFLRKEIEWIHAGAQARSTKQKSRIEHFEKIAAMEVQQEHEKLELKSATTRLGNNTIALEHVSKSFGENHLFSDFSYTIKRMDRVGIIGANGCGKSTLLKIIMGMEKADTGTIQIGETVKIGYFAQHNDVFEDDQRVIDYLKEFGSVVYTADHEEITASQMLERFLFFKEDQYKMIAKCSGGEKRRLYLCSILMQAPNILILDEPTNDLDTDTLGVLEDYLDDFHGAVLAVSHDRYFLDKTMDHLLVFDDQKIIEKQVSYSDYLEAKANEKEPAQVQPVKEREKRPSNHLSYKEKKELERLEQALPQLEQDIASLEEQLSSVTDFKEIQTIGDQLQSKRDELEESEQTYLELSEKAE